MTTLDSQRSFNPLFTPIPPFPMEITSNPRVRVLAVLLVATVILATLHFFSAENSVLTADAQSNSPQCNDGIDNDTDGRIDYPQDQDCAALDDNTEGSSSNGGVFLTLSDGKDEIRPGNSVVYVITVQSERSDVTEVDVQLLLPYQANVVSANNSGRIEGKRIYWDNITVTPGSSKKLTVNVSTDPYAEEGNLMLAEATADGGVKAVDTTRIVGKTSEIKNAFQISISDDRKFAEPDELLTYSVVVKNTSDSSRSYDLSVQLPQQTIFDGATGDYKEDSNTLMWDDYSLAPGATQEFIIRAYILKGAPDFYALTARAYIGNISATDTTSVAREGNIPAALSLAVTDGYSTVQAGSIIDYEITLTNETNSLATDVIVTDTLPSYAEFVSATEGGQWTGSNIVWRGLTVSPFGQRVLFVKARIRDDAPLGTRLRNGVVAEGKQAVDVTEIDTRTTRGGATAGRILPSNPTRPGRVTDRNNTPYQNDKLLVRKTADRSEVRPGSVIRFTVTVRNTTDHTIRNVLVDDRMNSPYVTITDAGSGYQEGTRMTWTIPELSSGEVWETQYSVRISSDAPHGMSIANVVSISGSGIETVSLTERVYTTNVAVVTHMPETGFGLDALFLWISAAMGAIPTIGMRKWIA